MIGVVVWSSASRKQAVIWCDDHAALAYLSGWEHLKNDGAWPEPGEIMQLETETIGEIRHARNVRPIHSAPCDSLPVLLGQRPKAHLALVHDGEPQDQPVSLKRCVGV